jgi:hypothetical protein
MVLPLLARVAAAGAAGYGMKKIDEEEKAKRKAREDRKAERSGKSGDPRSRGRRMPESYTEIDPVTGIGKGIRHTIEGSRDDARYYSNRKDDYLTKRETGEPYSLEEIQEGNRRFKSDKAKAERKKKEVKAAKEYIEGMKKGGSVKKSRDGIAQRGKTKGRMC